MSSVQYLFFYFLQIVVNAIEGEREERGRGREREKNERGKKILIS